MAANIETLDSSVYTTVPIETRADTSVYRLVRELVVGRGLTSVLDVGCSDGVVAYAWSETKPDFIGVDVAWPALTANHTEAPVQADARRLPFRDDSFDGVLALDIVEHFKPPEAVRVLSEMQRVGMLGHTALVSMPVVDPTRLFAIREGLGVLKNGRPKTGLFDATHHILRGSRFHKTLFSAAGYEVAGEYSTIGMTNGSRDQKGHVAVRSTQAAEGITLGKKLIGLYEKYEDRPGMLAKVIGHLLTYQKVYELHEAD